METAVRNDAAEVAAVPPAVRLAHVHFGITMNPVESSQIDAVGYDVESKTLAIQFKPKMGSDKPGSIYHYENVDAEQYAAFQAAESVGSHFYKHIKPFAEKFPYTRML